MMHERRAYPRFELDGDVWLGEDGVFTRGTERLKNVSLGGAFIRADGGYPKGSILSLQFSVGPASVTSTVTVRNVPRDGGIGVQFLDISDENLMRLAVFLGMVGAA